LRVEVGYKGKDGGEEDWLSLCGEKSHEALIGLGSAFVS